MSRIFLLIGFVCALAGCVTTPQPLKTKHLAVQWETDEAASGFWTAERQVLDQGEVPKVMVDFQDKQPTRPHGSINQIAYYEVEGYVVPLQYEHRSDSTTHYILHIVSVQRMEPARHDLPPFIKLHP